MSMVEKWRVYWNGLKDQKIMNMKDLLTKISNSKMMEFWKKDQLELIKVPSRMERSMVKVFTLIWKIKSDMKDNIRMDWNVVWVQFIIMTILSLILEIFKETYQMVKVMWLRMVKKLMLNLRMVLILKGYNDAYCIFIFHMIWNLVFVKLKKLSDKLLCHKQRFWTMYLLVSRGIPKSLQLERYLGLGTWVRLDIKDFILIDLSLSCRSVI